MRNYRKKIISVLLTGALSLAGLLEAHAAWENMNIGSFTDRSMKEKIPFGGAFTEMSRPEHPKLPGKKIRRTKLFFGKAKGLWSIVYNVDPKRYPHLPEKVREFGYYTLRSADEKNNKYVFDLREAHFIGEYQPDVKSSKGYDPAKANESAEKKPIVATMEIRVEGDKLIGTVLNADSSKISYATGEIIVMKAKNSAPSYDKPVALVEKENVKAQKKLEKEQKRLEKKQARKAEKAS